MLAFREFGRRWRQLEVQGKFSQTWKIFEGPDAQGRDRPANALLSKFIRRGKNCHAKNFREDLCARQVAADENGTKSGHFGKQREEERGAQIQEKSSQTW